MKKQVVLNLVFNETVSLKNSEVNVGKIKVNKFDDCNITVSFNAPGWLVKDEDAFRLARQMMHDRVDRQFDRFI